MKNDNKRSFFFILIFIGMITIIGLLILINFEEIKQKIPFDLPSNESSQNVDFIPTQENLYIPTETVSLSTSFNEEHVSTPEPEQIHNNSFSAEDYLILLSTLDGNFFHLFLNNPETTTLTRLSSGNWNDIQPEFSPDGTKIAFSSNRNGYWNIYILNLEDGITHQLTDDFDYVANPTWSPDGLWIAYESNKTGNIDIFIVSTDNAEHENIQLTNDEVDNFSPDWAPDGRSIVFTKSDPNDTEIWMVNLDNSSGRFTNISNNPDKEEQYPEWSPDGQFVSWSTMENDQFSLYKKDLISNKTVLIGSGKQHIWNDYSDIIFSEIAMPNYYLLVGYNAQNGLLKVPPFRLPGKIIGLDSTSDPDSIKMLNNLVRENDIYSEPSLWIGSQNNENIPGSRASIVELGGIEAPFAYIHDAADESFYALKNQVAQETGWDFLSSLENAYLPLTEPPSPDMQIDWLFTARAININPASLYANWMAVVKENYFGQTFWRIYLKARFQDGSQGFPLTQNVWDFNARYLGDPKYYETGGRPAPAPDGYWIDFTDIALRYGWQRFPALSNWRTYFDGTLFNQFVFTEGLDWDTAMQELYPPELLATSTRIPTQVLSLSPTPEYTISPTNTLIPTYTLTPTIHPTWTPGP